MISRLVHDQQVDDQQSLHADCGEDAVLDKSATTRVVFTVSLLTASSTFGSDHHSVSDLCRCRVPGDDPGHQLSRCTSRLQLHGFHHVIVVMCRRQCGAIR